MTEQEFLKLITDSGIRVYHVPVNDKPVVHKQPTVDDFLYEKCTIGRLLSSGHDDGNREFGWLYFAVPGEEEPDNVELDKILELIVPDISYLNYKKLINGLIKYDSYEDDKYYGTATIYGTKKIVLKDLYEKLKVIK